MTKEKLDGLWWLPENPDKQVAGTLVVFGNGRQELRLIGSLRDPWSGAEVTQRDDGSAVTQMTRGSIEQNGLYPRIHGVVGTTNYDLEDCFQLASTMNLFGGVGAERIHVHQSFSNVLFEVDEEVAFSRAQISLLGLAYWVMETGLEESMTFKEEKAGNITDIAHQIKISHVPDVKFTGPDGENLRFSHTYTMGGDRRTELRFTQDFKFVVEPDSLRAPGEYMKVSSALQDLLTIAIGRPSVLREVVFRHPDTKRVLGEKEYYPAIVNRAQWAVRPAKRKKPLSQNDVIFNLDDFGGPEKVTKWLEVASANRSTLSRVMATKYSVDMFAGDLFFSCAAALEAYDRTMFADDIYYVDRLNTTVAFVGHVRGLCSDVAWRGAGVYGASGNGPGRSAAPVVRPRSAGRAGAGSRAGSARSVHYRRGGPPFCRCPGAGDGEEGVGEHR
ncbi:hypothetical protein [Kocuria rosea]|uniref:ApeA N-terminal domain 1-containing protein n=1 Tax=Kocuria rosea TaxID=1275 RepID=UPI000ADA0A2E|nr:hypothetical protein [Kocuria polaris]